jgi:hypothetical protein
MFKLDKKTYDKFSDVWTIIYDSFESISDELPRSNEIKETLFLELATKALLASYTSSVEVDDNGNVNLSKQDLLEHEVMMHKYVHMQFDAMVQNIAKKKGKWGNETD